MSEISGLVDYHIHPGYSIDAQPVSVESYCRRAVELKLVEICFTTHLEVDPVRRNLDWYVRCDGQIRRMDDPRWLDRYFSDLHKARDNHAPHLAVKAGLEVGYEPGREETIERILDAFPFDFVLGSIHCLDHVAISSKRECAGYFSRRNATEVATDYFNRLEQAVQAGLFDCIAHVDLYRRYGTAFLGPDADDLHRGHVEKIFRGMAQRGMGLEINTSGLRRGLGKLHPSPDIMKTAVQSGINIFTTGSDAHSLAETGQGIDVARRLLSTFSLSPTTFTRRKPDSYTGVDKPAALP